VPGSAGLPQGPGVPDWDPPATFNERLQAAESGIVPRLRVADLVEPWVMAHRMGGANIGPDNTMEAMEAVVAAGHRIVDGGDVRLLRDGSLVCMHDTTIDRTTTGSATASDLIAGAWKGLAVDAGSWFAPAWSSTIRPPFFEDVVAFASARGLVITPEAKTTSCVAPMIDVIQRYRMEQSTIFLSFTQSDLVAPKAAGIATCLLVGTAISGAAITSAAGDDVDYIAYDYTVSGCDAAWVASVVAAGIKPMAYTVNRRTDWAAEQAKGAVCVASDDPLYLAETSPVLASDPFAAKTWYSGMFNINDPTATRGVMLAPNFLQLPAGGQPLVFQGWAELPSTYTLTFTIKYVEDGGTTAQHADVAFSLPNHDARYDHLAGAYGDGYHFIGRFTGSFQVFKVTGGVVTSLGNYASTAISEGTEVTFTIQVTGTQIIVTRVDTGHSFTGNDSAFRGTGLALGKGGGSTADFYFKSVSYA
jgi:glycerophosphoryl diester phosphodiesterase